MVIPTTPMILELFLASRMPAIFGMYPEFSSSCWTRFTVSSEIFSVLYHSNFFFSVSLIIWYNKSTCFTKVKCVTHHKIRGSFLLYFTKYTKTQLYFCSLTKEKHLPFLTDVLCNIIIFQCYKLEVSDFFFRYSLFHGFPHDRNNLRSPDVPAGLCHKAFHYPQRHNHTS